MTKDEMISGLWEAIGNLPCSHADFLGEELYEAVGAYLGWIDEDDEVDSEIEED